MPVVCQGSCKFLAVVMLYTQTSTIFWMLCEGIYLHTLIIVAVFVGEQQLFWYYVLGWGELKSSTVVTTLNLKWRFPHGRMQCRFINARQ